MQREIYIYILQRENMREKDSSWKYWNWAPSNKQMREKIRKENLKRTKKILETKLCSRNLIRRINIWAVPLVKYFGLFLKQTKEEL